METPGRDLQFGSENSSKSRFPAKKISPAVGNVVFQTPSHFLSHICSSHEAWSLPKDRSRSEVSVSGVTFSKYWFPQRKVPKITKNVSKFQPNYNYPSTMWKRSGAQFCSNKSSPSLFWGQFMKNTFYMLFHVASAWDYFAYLEYVHLCPHFSQRRCL